MVNIVMLGAPGSGKGTQAIKIAEKFGIPHISTGDMFREIDKEDSELGRMVKEILMRGGLVSDEATERVLKNRLSRGDAYNGVVMDGYPRTLEQAYFLETLFKVDVVVDIEVRDVEAVKRITSRRVCSSCNAHFNIFYIKPREEDKCDECGGELIQREDAKPEAVHERLRLYHEKTVLLENYYAKQGLCLRINGEQPIQKVFDDIISGIFEKLQR